MFHETNRSIRYRRRRDFGRERQWRELDTGSNGLAYDETHLPMMDRQNDMSRRGVRQRRPSPLDSYDPLQHARASRCRSPIDSSYRSTVAHDSPRHQTSSLPFYKAAKELARRLCGAISVTQTIETEFSRETLGIAAYADTKTLDHLWSAKLDWAGNISGHCNTPSSDADCGGVKTYRNTINALMNAFRDFRSADEPQSLCPGGIIRHFDPRVSRLLLQRLQASYSEIVELLQNVRSRKEKMKALWKELHLAQELLYDMRELWEDKAPSAPSQGRGKMKVVWADQIWDSDDE